MRSRCYYPKDKEYLAYGGSGVIVCDRWKDSFENFLADMGSRPNGTTLDRWPNKAGNYEPGNCRWATISEQRNNRRNFKRVVSPSTRHLLSDQKKQWWASRKKSLNI